MLTFLFWNLNESHVMPRIARLVRAHAVDVLMLAESDIDPQELLQAPRTEGYSQFSMPFSQSAKIQIFTRVGSCTLNTVFDDASGRMTIRRLLTPAPQDVLLAVVHYHSKRNWPADDQASGCSQLARDIAAVEERHRNFRTILVGDLNMNPFEQGMVSAHGLHSVMTRQLALKESRIVAGSELRYFYNPMWGCFGDCTDGPPSTHFYPCSQPTTYFWNMFDQVLFRPALLSAFRGDLQILDSDGEQSFLSKSGIPDKINGSDHLPILFRLDL